LPGGIDGQGSKQGMDRSLSHLTGVSPWLGSWCILQNTNFQSGISVGASRLAGDDADDCRSTVTLLQLSRKLRQQLIHADQQRGINQQSHLGIPLMHRHHSIVTVHRITMHFEVFIDRIDDPVFRNGMCRVECSLLRAVVAQC